eukprot:2243092-Pyramimonas_sp.AAC.1
MASRRTIPIKADVVLHKRCTRVAHALHMCYTSVAQAFHKRCPSVTQALPKRYPSVTPVSYTHLTLPTILLV